MLKNIGKFTAMAMLFILAIGANHAGGVEAARPYIAAMLLLSGILADDVTLR